MPSAASELFYTRRSRLNRAAVAAAAHASVSGIGSGFENSADRNPHPAHHSRRQSQSQSHHSHRHDLDGCDLLRRSPHLRNHRASHLERATVSPDQSNRQSAPSNNNSMNVEPQRNIRRPSELSSSDRLPGSVLLARERLLERLRGVSLSGNSRSRDLLRTTGNDHLFDDQWRLADASDWGGAEISTRSSSSGSPIDNPNLPADRPDPTNGKKPPGLSQNAIDSLHMEVFCCREKTIAKRISKDCSICLENFTEGDKLICLPCNHRFHSICLDPWIQSCGDCPYCRKAITEVGRNT